MGHGLLVSKDIPQSPRPVDQETYLRLRVAGPILMQRQRRGRSCGKRHPCCSGRGFRVSVYASQGFLFINGASGIGSVEPADAHLHPYEEAGLGFRV